MKYHSETSESGPEPKWKEIPDEMPPFGDLMTMAEWLETVGYGGFIDYDGFGHYATKTEYLDGPVVSPSMVSKGLVDQSYTHIIWFNR